MSQERIQAPSSHGRGADQVGSSSKFFLGLSLSGGKTDKACLVVLEYFEDQGRLFLHKVYEKIKNEDQLSSDLKIYELLKQYEAKTVHLALDVPHKLPACLRCHLPCPGYENCHEPHIQWMWNDYLKHRSRKRPQKLFTPYTQRCVELYLQNEIEEKFILSHAMGSNAAPLLARASFLLRRVSFSVIEAWPKLTLWRIGNQFKIMKSHLRGHRHASYGEQSRRSILHTLGLKNLFFIYEQDKKTLIQNQVAFDATMLAYTAYLKHKNLTEPRPPGFPEYEDWIEFPRDTSQS